MHRDAIQVWIQTIAATSPFHDPAFAADEQSRILAGIDDASLNKAKPRSNLYSTSSPSKRQQLRDVPDDVATDPETAPRRPQRENRVHITDESPAPSFAHGEMPPQQSGSSAPPSVAQTSVFTGALASRPHFATLAMDQRPHSTGSSASSVQRRRRKSPSKPHRKVADLMTLDRPVRFKMEMNMRAVLSSDVQRLYNALVKAERGEGILPPSLTDIPGMDPMDISPYMWQQLSAGTDT